jgi:hypothetical protein
MFFFLFFFFFLTFSLTGVLSSAPQLESSLTAALGVGWAHAVNIRYVLDAHASGKRLRVGKSPNLDNVACNFVITGRGIDIVAQLTESSGGNTLAPNIQREM